jgi:PhnB protein
MTNKPENQSQPKPIRDGFHTITPYLIGRNTPRLIEFLGRAFDGKLISRKDRPDGSVMHAEMRIGNSMLMMGDSTGNFAPMPTAIYLYVPDCDVVYRHALAAGGSSVSELRDMPSGERYGGVKDPCGNIWWVATHVEDVSPDEENRRWNAFKR